jgi:hypothetical protein
MIIYHVEWGILPGVRTWSKQRGKRLKVLNRIG